MKDKKTESDIKILNGFLEFWAKFHSIYSEVLSKDIISDEDEAKFFSVRDAIRSKYEALGDSLEFKYAPHSRMTDPVEGVLSINSIRLMSEKGLKKLEDDWRDSYVFLNSIAERLKNKKRRLGGFNPVGVFLKRFFEGKVELSGKGEAK